MNDHCTTSVGPMDEFEAFPDLGPTLVSAPS